MAGEATSSHKGGNPWHDPKSGRFTSGPAAGAAEPGNPPESSGNEIVVTAPRFRTQGDRPSAGPPHLPPEQLLAAIKQTGLLSLRIAQLHAEHAADFRDTLIKKYGLPAPLAAALAANAEMESGVDASVTQSGKTGKGLDESTADQQIKYQLYELAHGEQRKFALAQRVGSDAASLAAGYSYYVIRPKKNFRNSSDRYAVARALDKIPIK